LRAAGYEVTTGVGKTGVVGLLRNGEGPTVMLRADGEVPVVLRADLLPSLLWPVLPLWCSDTCCISRPPWLHVSARFSALGCALWRSGTAGSLPLPPRNKQRAPSSDRQA
jgi:hypothetical protein